MDVETLAKELRRAWVLVGSDRPEPMYPWDETPAAYQSCWLAVARRAIELLWPITDDFRREYESQRKEQRKADPK